MSYPFARKATTVGRIFTRWVRRVPSLVYIWFIELKIPREINPENSFLQYYANKYSQVGQDGIIEELVRRLEISRGSFCEFGAWDGSHLSNARKLIEEGWEGVFIEGDPHRFQSLIQNYPSPQIVKINEWVGYSNSTKSVGRSLDEILLENVSSEYIKNLDLLIIDVDGVDLEIALSSKVRPKIMLLEGGSSFAPTINAPFPFAKDNFQHPLEYIVCEMLKIGYIPICFHQDLFMIRQDLVNQVLMGKQMVNSKELFIQSFYFLPRRERRYQMLKRLESPYLRDFELGMLGSFHPNPLRNI